MIFPLFLKESIQRIKQFSFEITRKIIREREVLLFLFKFKDQNCYGKI